MRELRLSRDGARFAAVVGQSGSARLVVGRVSRTRDGVRLDGVRDVLPGFGDIAGVAWAGADEIVVTAADPGGGRQVVATDPSGYSTRTIATDAVIGDPVAVAAAPGAPLVVVAAGDLWVQSGSGWRRIGAGSDPVYPD